MQQLAGAPELRASGFAPVAFGTAEEALQHLDGEHLPAMALIDVDLPGMSGLEALRILRQDDATRHIPVIAVSANAMPLDLVNGLSAGFFRYLTKPFQIDRFLQVLDEALALARNNLATLQQ